MSAVDEKTAGGVVEESIMDIADALDRVRKKVSKLKKVNSQWSKVYKRITRAYYELSEAVLSIEDIIGDNDGLMCDHCDDYIDTGTEVEIGLKVYCQRCTTRSASRA